MEQLGLILLGRRPRECAPHPLHRVLPCCLLTVDLKRHNTPVMVKLEQSLSCRGETSGTWPAGWNFPQSFGIIARIDLVKSPQEEFGKGRQTLEVDWVNHLSFKWTNQVCLSSSRCSTGARDFINHVSLPHG